MRTHEIGADAVNATTTVSPERRSLRGGEFAFAALAFPIAVVVTQVGAYASMARGVDPNLSILPWLVLFFGFIAVAERIVPWQRAWLRSHGDVRTDVLLYVTNGAIGILFNPLVLVASAYLGARLAGLVGVGLWPTAWPLAAQLALALVVAEFVEYSLHRMMHEIPWLWRFHATHHSAQRLYWLNAVRFHPIDLFLVGTMKLVPVALLGADAQVFALVNLFSGVHGAFQHANVPVRIGPLNWIFSMSELHRWHHSKSIAEANHNYGGNLAFWDVVFGTRYLPRDRDPPADIGIETMPHFPAGYWDNLAAPFRWERVAAESTKRAARLL